MKKCFPCLALLAVLFIWLLSLPAGAEEISLPESTVTLGQGAFRGDRFLARVIVPSGCVAIGDEAFRDCPYLYSVLIPDSVTSIGEHAFENAGRAVICCNEGSYASSYAAAHGIKTVPIDVIAAGMCGDDAVWKITGDGVLEIYGTGSTYNYSLVNAVGGVPGSRGRYGGPPWSNPEGSVPLDSYVHSIRVWL